MNIIKLLLGILFLCYGIGDIISLGDVDITFLIIPIIFIFIGLSAIISVFKNKKK